jgi:hypothetical protein
VAATVVLTVGAAACACCARGCFRRRRILHNFAVFSLRGPGAAAKEALH